jgi:hypothetical protein
MARRYCFLNKRSYSRCFLFVLTLFLLVQPRCDWKTTFSLVQFLWSWAIFRPLVSPSRKRCHCHVHLETDLNTLLPSFLPSFLHALEQLALIGNGFSGSVPDNICNIPSLSDIVIEDSFPCDCFKCTTFFGSF